MHATLIESKESDMKRFLPILFILCLITGAAIAEPLALQED